MARYRRLGAVTAAATAALLTVSACSSSKKDTGSTPTGGSTSSAPSGGTTGVKAAYNAAVTGVVNASDQTGGTVKYAMSDAPDSFDPGNTYYALVWDFARLYSRALTTFAPAAGDESLVLKPDLADGLGKVSDGGKTWTYKIRAGLKYDDGTPITTADVKYAIERSNYAREVLSNGPTYFSDLLVDNTPAYKGPYVDKGKEGLKSIVTPDDTTIVFHLKAPFADFDFLTSNPQTAPVPAAKDTGAKYVNHVVSSGSYMFKSYDDGKGAVLAKNPNWSADSDPIRKQYPDEIDVKFGQEQTSIDQDLQAGDLTLDLTGVGVAASTQPTILNDPDLKANADDALAGSLFFMAITNKVKPFDNIDCRKAVQYAVDKKSVQTSGGGPIRGDIATTMLPPNVIGYQKFDVYPSTDGGGDVAKAKEFLTKCGKPNGFDTALTLRSDRPNEVAAGTAIQASLKKVGINVTILQYPSGKYFSDYAGAPAFVHSHNAGLLIEKWGADWPTGYGFLDQVVDGKTIKASGNTNLAELDDPKINKALSDAIADTDEAARTKAWGEIDRMVMEAAAFVPLIYNKNLLFRPPNATNVVFSNGYGLYDYLNVGTK